MEKAAITRPRLPWLIFRFSKRYMGNVGSKAKNANELNRFDAIIAINSFDQSFFCIYDLEDDYKVYQDKTSSIFYHGGFLKSIAFSCLAERVRIQSFFSALARINVECYIDDKKTIHV